MYNLRQHALKMFQRHFFHGVFDINKRLENIIYETIKCWNKMSISKIIK